MKNSLYNEYVQITPELDTVLKKCFVNHLLLYNQALTYLYKDEELSFKNLKKQILVYISEKNIKPIIDIALYNEIYYQYKKFKRNIKIQKLITDIQYFTFLCKNYVSKALIVSEDRKSIKFEDFEGQILLNKELPTVDEEDLIYINISFSNIENKYMISVYKSST